MSGNRQLAGVVLLLVGIVVAGCAGESAARGSFRTAILGSPTESDQFRAFKSGEARELLWLKTRDGLVESKLWARVDLAGVGGKMSGEPVCGSDIPFAVAEQMPCVVTYRFELYTLRQFHEIDAWKLDPAAALPLLFPHADRLLTAEKQADLHGRALGDDTLVIGGEAGAERLWLRVRADGDYIHARGYLSALWPGTLPSDELSSFGRRPLLCDLALWSWYQANSRAGRDREGLWRNYKFFCVAMENWIMISDPFRTEAEMLGGMAETYDPGSWYWLFQCWSRVIIGTLRDE